MKHQMKYILWLVLALPAFGLTNMFVSGGASAGELLHPTGEFSARFMIIAMLATPLLMLFQQLGWSLAVPRWILKHRRALGVAAFVYAALHTVLYLLDVGAWAEVISELTALGIWTGWLAFLIFIPLAITSNNRSQQYLRGTWKKLQRWVYPAAVLTLMHWIFVENNLGPALVHFVPLAALELYRLYSVYTAKSQQ